MEEYESIAREHELRNVFEEDPIHLRLEIQPFLDTLTKPDKELLQLYFFDNLTSEEIGRRLQLNPATVRMKKARLLSKLQEHLAK
jgi:RNA polymerase sigma factor (sigma-70 family)